MLPLPNLYPNRHRTVWISDIHLGFKGCKAEYLLDFLKSIECEHLYLVGDVVDFWSMKKMVHWPQAHNDIILTILDMAKRGVKVIYVPGNHDEMMRDYNNMSFGNVQIRKSAMHKTADGRRLLILHGDEFDGVIKCSKLAEILGNVGYDFLLFLNRLTNNVRGKLGFPYWSLATFLKQRVKNAMRHVENFELAAVHEARRQGADGVVCGHIHHAEAKQLQGISYCNTGDWVENCTALVENASGHLELLHWSERQQSLKLLEPIAMGETKAA